MTMALDDIFNEEEPNFERLHSEEQRLKKVIMVIAAIGVLCWSFIVYYIRGFDIGYFVGVSVVLVFLPLVVALVLTTLVALFPYRGFSYKDRFFRYFLLVLMLLYITINVLGLIGFVRQGYVF